MSDIVWCGLSGLTLSIIIVAQSGYEDDLFEKSLEFIPRLQEGASHAAKLGWKSYADWGLNIIMFVPFAVNYIFIKQRPRAYYYMFVAASIDAISSIIKLN